MKTGVMRQALVVAAIYFAATYYLDQPDELSNDAAAIAEMAQNLPDPDDVLARAEAKREKASQSVSNAKRRLDHVKGRVEESIALGAERFSAAD